MSGLAGKRVKLWFDDMGKVLFKQGVIVSEDLVFTQIKENGIIQVIPTSKIVRMEVVNG